MPKIFETSDFTIESLVKNKILKVSSVIFPDFYCRIWLSQREQLVKLLGAKTGMFTASDCIYDVDNHYNDFAIEKTKLGAVVTIFDYSNNIDFSVRYELTTEDLETLLRSVVDFFGN